LESWIDDVLMKIFNIVFLLIDALRINSVYACLITSILIKLNFKFAQRKGSIWLLVHRLRFYSQNALKIEEVSFREDILVTFGCLWKARLNYGLNLFAFLSSILTDLSEFISSLVLEEHFFLGNKLH
jgi:hypothetical protein